MRKTSNKNLKKELRQLLKKNAFFKQKITLSSGKQSDYYIDGRLVTLSAYGAWLCAKVILGEVGKERIAAIGGPTIGADPMIGALAAISYLEHKPINTFIIRKSSKKHGRMKLIEGPLLKKGSRVIIIDDVATTGGSLVDSIKVLRKRGIRIQKAIVIVDRQEGARERLVRLRCPLISIFTASDFLD
ncbi:orotate phosphoribosyltransferase [Candidatus Omnitrophota bacterium]